jgi:hypothetical protein
MTPLKEYYYRPYNDRLDEIYRIKVLTIIDDEYFWFVYLTSPTFKQCGNIKKIIGEV